MTRRLSRIVILATLVTGCSDGSLPPSVQDELVSAPPAQREVVADGRIDRAEYERAVELGIACMRDRGLSVIGPAPYWKNPEILDYGWGVGDSGMSEALALRAHDGCYEEHLGSIDRAWQAQNPPPQEILDEETDLIAECFRRRGLSVEGDATREEIERIQRDHVESASGCAAEAAVEMLDRRTTAGGS